MIVEQHSILGLCLSRIPKMARAKIAGRMDITGRCGELLSFTSLERLSCLIPLVEQKKAANDLKDWREQGIMATSPGDEYYPESFLELSAVPLIVFYRGAAPTTAPLERCIAVVGSRDALPPMCSFAFRLSKAIVEESGSVISGLALGIDASAHQGALESSGAVMPTIAVLGNGLARVYPARHRDLARAILAKGGGILSQFEPSTPPLPHHFLMRNQLIAALAKTTVVVSAAQRSGALSTARAALELGRDVASVPGAVFDPTMVGCNRLLHDGAQIITEVAEIRDYLPQGKSTLIKVNKEFKESNLSPNKEFLSYIAKNGKTHLDDLIDRFGSTAIATITDLELAGSLTSLPGGWLLATD
jgi:DNA processing protein